MRQLNDICLSKNEPNQRVLKQKGSKGALLLCPMGAGGKDG